MQAVILAGGVGSRLWPVSNKTRPKPFIKMDDGQSLLQKVFLRAANCSLVTNIITVANYDLISQIQEEYSGVENALKKPITSHFILEPYGKNTAAAIASAALVVQEYYGPNEMMLMLPADHLISDQSAFEEAVIKAKSLASNGAIVTFGIKPDRPEVGYGYIEHDGNSVKCFVEKPSLQLAQEYIARGDFLWNSGMFCFTAGSILQEMEKHCPAILNQVRHSMCLVKGKQPIKIELDSVSFNLVPKESIDYAVIEKSDKIKVIPCDIGWQDIGTWSALSKLSTVDSCGNRVQGKATLHNVSDCYIENNGALLGVVGVKNLAIISTKNGFLVTSKQNSEEVRNIYSQLQNNISDIQEFFWGRVEEMQENQNIKMHRIEVNPAASIDISKYFPHSANWIVAQGCAQFFVNNQLSNLSINESQYIQMGRLARLTNIGDTLLTIITIQLDDYLSQNGIMSSIEIGKVSNG